MMVRVLWLWASAYKWKTTFFGCCALHWRFPLSGVAPGHLTVPPFTCCCMNTGGDCILAGPGLKYTSYCEKSHRDDKIIALGGADY